MFEVTTDPRIAEAIRLARAERARVFVGLFKGFSLSRFVPLSHPALTEPTR